MDTNTHTISRENHLASRVNVFNANGRVFRGRIQPVKLNEPDPRIDFYKYIIMGQPITLDLHILCKRNPFPLMNVCSHSTMGNVLEI